MLFIETIVFNKLDTLCRILASYNYYIIFNKTYTIIYFYEA